MIRRFPRTAPARCCSKRRPLPAGSTLPGPAMWGVMTTLSRSNKGLSAGVGSSSNTSSPAAAIVPWLKARCKRLLVNHRTAAAVDQEGCGFHHFQLPSEIMPRVRRVKGTCNEMMSDSRSTSSKDTGVTFKSCWTSWGISMTS